MVRRFSTLNRLLVETRNAIALNMFRAWYVPLYYYGVIHGDPILAIIPCVKIFNQSARFRMCECFLPILSVV